MPTGTHHPNGDTPPQRGHTNPTGTHHADGLPKRGHTKPSGTHHGGRNHRGQRSSSRVPLLFNNHTSTIALHAIASRRGHPLAAVAYQAPGGHTHQSGTQAGTHQTTGCTTLWPFSPVRTILEVRADAFPQRHSPNRSTCHSQPPGPPTGGSRHVRPRRTHTQTGTHRPKQGHTTTAGAAVGTHAAVGTQHQSFRSRRCRFSATRRGTHGYRSANGDTPVTTSVAMGHRSPHWSPPQRRGVASFVCEGMAPGRKLGLPYCSAAGISGKNCRDGSSCAAVVANRRLLVRHQSCHPVSPY